MTFKMFNFVKKPSAKSFDKFIQHMLIKIKCMIIKINR